MKDFPLFYASFVTQHAVCVLLGCAKSACLPQHSNGCSPPYHARVILVRVWTRHTLFARTFLPTHRSKSKWPPPMTRWRLTSPLKGTQRKLIASARSVVVTTHHWVVCKEARSRSLFFRAQHAWCPRQRSLLTPYVGEKGLPWNTLACCWPLSSYNCSPGANENW